MEQLPGDQHLMGMRLVSGAIATLACFVAIVLSALWFLLPAKQPPSVPVPPDDIGMTLKNRR